MMIMNIFYSAARAPSARASVPLAASGRIRSRTRTTTTMTTTTRKRIRMWSKRSLLRPRRPMSDSRRREELRMRRQKRTATVRTTAAMKLRKRRPFSASVSWTTPRRIRKKFERHGIWSCEYVFWKNIGFLLRTDRTGSFHLRLTRSFTAQ
ncbi:hypothetical protein MPH_07344 [Macrophomina phaseolina MS6]|uniref:Uncharacterized protein n=1 Tax=Macrophomina phaseolina (strain MS6) TaxID=1126212 RepID=K2RLA2_MACPH|nr:hypothetical protein MPH_07344 [Macrophomina phaseolina MS6]